ncbi:MAG: alpha/beta fold hydrolase, partial [Caulobacter sp.]
MRRLAPRLLACAWLIAGAAQARPYSIEDLLERQRLGPVTLAPGDRWLVLSSTAPYRTATRFDLGYQSDLTIARLDVVDLEPGPRPLQARRLLGDDGYGYEPGPVSPSGEKMAVARIQGHDMELGVVTLATGQTVWTGLAPVANFFGRTMQWRGEDELVAVVRDPDAPSFTPVYDWQVQRRLQDAWRATAQGGVGQTLVGSGRYLDQHRPSPPRRLVRIDAATGRSRQIALGDVMDLELSPDGRQLAVLAAAQAVQPDPGLPAGTAEPFRRHRLAVIDVETGAAWSPCPACEFAVDLLDWSPSGRQLLAYGKADEDGWARAAYWRIMPSTHRSQALDLAGARPATGANINAMRLPAGQWLGEAPLVLVASNPAGASSRRDWLLAGEAGPILLTRMLPAGADQLMAVDARGVVIGDGRRLWRVTPRGRAASIPVPPGLALTTVPGAEGDRGERFTVNERPPSADLSLALTPADGPGGASIVRLDADRPSPVAMLEADQTPLAASARTGLSVSLRRDAHGVETVLVRRAGQKEQPPEPVLTLNPTYAAIDFSFPRPIPHKGPDGQAVTSWLYLPPGLEPGAKAPLVVVPYPGKVLPDAARGLPPPGRERFPNVQILAAAGYAVLVPSLPVDLSREPMEGTAEAILGVVDAAVTRGAPIDADRLALWGHSYGGYAVLAAATQSPRFKAVIAAAPSPDLIGAYGGGSPAMNLAPEAGYAAGNLAGWFETGQARMGAPPWRDPQRYVRNSPLLAADKVSAPVMLVVGDLDGDAKGPASMFNALYRLRKDALLVTYHGEGHQMFSPGNLRDLYARALSFLDDQLASGRR